MPTGYTHAIEKGITFEEFAWSCARAFGALIMLRDEPSDCPIPETFAPSDYHTKKLQESQGRLDWLNGLSESDLAKAAEDAHRAALTSHREYASQNAELRKKYEAMLENVLAWTPPTEEHRGLKDFMTQQIRDSLKFDCSYIGPDPLRMPAHEWRKGEIEKALREVAYHTKEHGEEVSRTIQRNQWIASLRGSLGSPLIKESKP